METSIIIVEDNAKIRDALCSIIARAGGFRCIGDFASAEEAQAFFGEEKSGSVAAALVDLGLPGAGGAEFIAWLKARRPDVQCLVLSAFEDADKVFGALRAGATGYLLKSAPGAQITDALHDILRGGSPMSSTIARKLVTEFAGHPAAFTPAEALTQRENDVLKQLSHGLSYQEIADALFVSLDTVRSHIRNIYAKLQAKNRKEALRKAGMY